MRFEPEVPLDTLRREFAAAADLRHLGLAVSLTEQCNFRCTYCYEDFAIGRMPVPIYSGLKRFVAARIPQLRSFALSWFGGEPLLEWGRMTSFTSYCRDLCAKHEVTISVATVSTNGYGLTPTVLQALVRSGVAHFMISLDGEPAVHDRTRRRLGGKPSFDSIYRNLLAAASDLDFHILLRLHLHADNLDSQCRLVERLARDFGADRRFDIHPIAIGDFGGPTVKSLRLVRRDLEENTRQRLFATFGRRPPEGSETVAEVKVCYAAKPNHLFIRPDGRLAKCTTALNRADNDIGRLHPDGTITVDHDKALAWSFGFRTGRRADLACPYWTKPQEMTVRLELRNRPSPAARTGPRA